MGRLVYSGLPVWGVCHPLMVNLTTPVA